MRRKSRIVNVLILFRKKVRTQGKGLILDSISQLTKIITKVFRLSLAQLRMN